MELGDIVVFKNLIFENSKVDHAFNRGRPCIYLGELDDKMCFISCCDPRNWDKAKKINFSIKPDKNNGFKKTVLPTIKNLIEKKPSFYNVIGYISDEQVMDIFLRIRKFYSDPKTEEDFKFVRLAESYFENHKYVDSEQIKKDKNK